MTKVSKKAAKAGGLKELGVAITPEIAKAVFSNIVQFHRIGKDNILMSFVFAEPDNSGNGTIVSRILVDTDHAKKIAEVLDGFLKKNNEK